MAQPLTLLGWRVGSSLLAACSATAGLALGYQSVSVPAQADVFVRKGALDPGEFKAFKVIEKQALTRNTYRLRWAGASRHLCRAAVRPCSQWQLCSPRCAHMRQQLSAWRRSGVRPGRAEWEGPYRNPRSARGQSQPEQVTHHLAVGVLRCRFELPNNQASAAQAENWVKCAAG